MVTTATPIAVMSPMFADQRVPPDPAKPFAPLIDRPVSDAKLAKLTPAEPMSLPATDATAPVRRTNSISRYLLIALRSFNVALL